MLLGAEAAREASERIATEVSDVRWTMAKDLEISESLPWICKSYMMIYILSTWESRTASSKMQYPRPKNKDLKPYMG